MNTWIKIIISSFILLVFNQSLMVAQENTNTSKFKQLGHELPTPNSYRSASGAPGHAYWQQKADYKMKLELDDENQRVYGDETITYFNNSPDELTYLWVQMDQNMRAKDSDTYKVQTGSMNDKMSFDQLKRMMYEFDGGFKLDHVKDANGNALPFTVNKTMMRVEMPKPLKTGESFTFQVKWWYNINDRMKIGGRSGYEYFEEDDNYLYTIAQFFPRMCVYDDVNGWQNKQFLGRGEFALTFGDYEVSITVPEDHLVSATGTLQNPKDVLTDKQIQKYEQAQKSFDEPVIIVSQSEAEAAEKKKMKGKKTWTFKAENVRDFAFASSRKFIWDAMGVKMKDGRTVMAMSMYPKEGNPLWEQYSTKAVAHTVKWFSHYTIEYPYPVAWSIHTKRIGMEYPMICFNYGRPEKDGTYTQRTKYGMIGVIIHEVGHNFFPMIINSDERQWTWMDEGLNTFVQYLTEVQWERDYPHRRGPAHKIVNYMKGDKENIVPIMTNSESILQFGNNAYGKPATALNILRETVMGRELFDYAFKEYCERWAFKHPEPADFFRSMEDASGVDLDWFWRGWFYTTDHCDIAMTDVEWFRIDTKDPSIGEKEAKEKRDFYGRDYSKMKNKEEIKQTQDEMDRGIRDFYSTYDPLDTDALDRQDYKRYVESLSAEEKKMLNSGMNFYQITFENVGGLVMPVILEFEYTDGTKEVERIPAEIWKSRNEKVTKVFMKKKEVKAIVLDPFLETADTDLSNNYYPERHQPSRFELFKSNNSPRENPMQRAERAKKVKP